MAACAKCKRVLNSEDAVACEVCGDTCCIPCSKLVPTELRVLQLKSPPSLIFCCQDCKVNIKNPEEIIRLLKDQIRLLMNTVRDKETIVDDKVKIISHLEVKIAEQTLRHVTNETAAAVTHSHASSSSVVNVPQTKTKNRTPMTSGSFSKTLENKQRNLMDRMINLAGDLVAAPRTQKTKVQSIGNPDEAAWNTVSYKKKSRNNKTTLGANVNQLCIRAVESRRNVFISRLSPDTTVEKISQHLMEHKVEPLSIQKLEIKSKDVAAFKVVIQQSDETQIMNGEMWPKYTIIRPYRQPRAFFPGDSQVDRLE